MATAAQRAIQRELFTDMLYEQQREYRSAAIRSAIALSIILGAATYAIVYRTTYAKDTWFTKYKLDVVADRLHLLLNNTTELGELACKKSAGTYFPKRHTCSVKRA